MLLRHDPVDLKVYFQSLPPPRVTQCKYKRIGCPWQGPYHELTVHEAECTHPTKTGNELMEILDEMDQTRQKEMQLYNSIFSLLSFEKIGYTGNAAGCPGPFRTASTQRFALVWSFSSSLRGGLKTNPRDGEFHRQRFPRHRRALLRGFTEPLGEGNVAGAVVFVLALRLGH